MVEGKATPSAITCAEFGLLRKMLPMIARPTTKSATLIGFPFPCLASISPALYAPLELEAAPARSPEESTTAGQAQRL
jgi:hypothetical protein